MWVPINSANSSGSCSENCGFRIARVVGCHSENGISYSENGILNSESCSENELELSESSENALFTPRVYVSSFRSVATLEDHRCLFRRVVPRLQNHVMAKSRPSRMSTINMYLVSEVLLLLRTIAVFSAKALESSSHLALANPACEDSLHRLF